VQRARLLVAGVLLTTGSAAVLLDVASPEVSSAPAPTTTAAVEVLSAVEVRPVPVVAVTADACGWRSHGSGVLLADGRVLTARHVVERAETVSVTLDGAPLSAEVVAITFDAHGRDAAVLDVPALAAQSGAVLARSAAPARTPIRVLGHPLGRALAEQAGVVAGQLTDGPLALDGGRVTTLDALVEEGMSGGPVVDPSGAVVGVAIGYEYNTRTGIAIPVDDIGDLLAGRGVDGRVDAAC
jgi:S1-C subfamily serine protease